MNALPNVAQAVLDYGEALQRLHIARSALATIRERAKRAYDSKMYQWRCVLADRDLYADFPTYMRDLAWVLNLDCHEQAALRAAERRIGDALDRLWVEQAVFNAVRATA